MKFRSLFVLSALISASAQAAPAPFASGESAGMKWEVRFNLPDCNHPGQAPGAWCDFTDSGAAVEKSGVEAALREAMLAPTTKSVQMAYFSFSNKRVKKSICEAAKVGKKVTIYIDQSSAAQLSNPEFQAADPNCDMTALRANLRVVPRGKGPFGTEGAYLQHMKIFMASPLVNPKPLHEMSAAEASVAKETRTLVTSSSANMSSFGTNLHFENWLFLDAKTSDHLAQANYCVFKALEAAGMNAESQMKIATTIRDCRARIASPERRDLKFFPVPHGNVNPKPYQALKTLLEGAREEVLVNIHRLTSSMVTRPMIRAIRNGAKFNMVMDDDTLRTGKVDGGHGHDVGAEDVKSHRDVRDAGGDVRFLETSAEGGAAQLHHNKFMVVDNKTLFQGAGNFTSASLNISAPGNCEQFYVITVPGIVQAYKRAHQEIWRRATPEANHPVGDHEDMLIVIGENGRPELVEPGSEE
ncbi:MAG: hypothetical protein IT285_03875 [Bdellovibrionales bacterium]|nr:hypothetical protein [Bdellovibrionales bacterium]